MSKLFGFLVGFRKFLIMVLFLVVMIVFRVKGFINGAEFAENLQLAVVAFFGTNMAEHMIKTAEKWIKEKFEGEKQ